MLHWRIGEVTVTRIVEMEMPIAYSERQPFLAEATPEALRAIPWLYPHFVNGEDQMLLSIHALLVEAPGLRLVVDTCIGNDKARGFLGGRALSTPFLDHLAEVGWNRETVDAVVCTHLHVDHVGWNTMRVGEAWVPTFPKARYLIGRREYEHWSAVDEGEQPQILADSVQPIFDAGLAELVEMDHRISPEIALVPSPGHTPGHVCVAIESRGERAVITGDSTHHPCQLAHPTWSPPFDSDPKASAAMRANLFADWAETGVLVIGTHYATPTAGRVRRDRDAYRLDV
jgi:glyoxylase-like metal-dependent hydrolase (beta-lactamase superfamily II)